MPRGVDVSLLAGAVVNEKAGFPEQAEVSVIDHEAFVERYIGVLMLGNTMLTGRRLAGFGVGSVEMVMVSPWQTNDSVPKQTRTREEAEGIVEKVLDNQRRAKAYRASGLLQRTVQVVKHLAGKESNYLGLPERFHTQLPGIITFRGEDKKLHEIVVDQTLEDQYRERFKAPSY